jgi:hypothetical protein
MALTIPDGYSVEVLGFRLMDRVPNRYYAYGILGFNTADSFDVIKIQSYMR